MAGGASFTLDVGSFDEVVQAALNFGDGALSVINDTLHEVGGELIRQEIQPLIPASGRTWKGKITAASATNPFASDDVGTMLQVTVKTSTKYNYLYFPDDGSNTKRHAGNQQFFKAGADNATQDIIDRCVEAVIQKFEEG